MYNLLSKIFFVLVLSASFPIGVVASELRLDANKVDVRVGEEFIVEVLMNADKPVNAVEGRIVFPKDAVEIREIRDGNSSINLWVEKPHSETGALVFSGITPGGFIGVNNQLFSVVFEAKQEGMMAISIAKATALENDGVGTETTLALRNIVLQVKAGDSSVRRNVIEDTVPPEPFTPTIAQDSSVFDGNFFLVFATQDKGSGIKRYEVREGRFGWWREAESPYLLTRQKLDKDIYMRVIDNADNERVAVVPATVSSTWWDHYVLFVILTMLILAVIVYKKVWVRFIK